MKSKKVKLSYFTRKHLERKGRRDAQNKIITYENSKSDLVISPFFKEEISICFVKIHSEYEDYLKQKQRYNRRSVKREKEKAKLRSSIQTIKEKNRSNEILLESLSKESQRISLDEKTLLSGEGDFLAFEKQALIELHKIQMQEKREALMHSISSYAERKRVPQSKIEELQAVEIKEKVDLLRQLDIRIEKCKQYYALTIARLSAYWTGVLTESQNNDQLFSSFYTKGLFNELKEEIANLQSLREEWK